MPQFIDTPAGRLAIDEPVPTTSSVKFSRLYGFRGTEPVPEEQEVIQHVIETIASSAEPIEQTVEKLVKELNDQGIRRSGKKWLRSTVLALLRPVFGGHIAVSDGFAVSQFYNPPIVSWDVMQRALARVK